MSWVQPYHAQCARQWLSATATAMHVARPRSRPSHATQRPFRTHYRYRTYPGAARGVDISLAACMLIRGRGGRAPCLPHEGNGARVTHAHGARSMHTKSNTHAPYGITLLRTLHTVMAWRTHLSQPARRLSTFCLTLTASSYAAQLCKAQVAKAGAHLFAPALLMLFMISSATSSASSTSSTVFLYSLAWQQRRCSS